MSRGGDATQWTAEQTLSYINGMIAADDKEDENTQYTALSIAYEYLTNATKRKITWSLSLQKLAYEFIELAFQTNMHVAIKDVFKSYRAITQGQYSESLKCVLEHYRDAKLQTILEEDITAADLPLIRGLPNIETEQPSTEIILHSLHPETVQREMQVRSKLRIVWQGYKSIVETVRVNQKLQDVYMATLNKIFDFVERYNRVQEFKSFCRSLRTGLQTAFNKRDKAEQQKAIYIDIEKTDVNTRNIEIRMEQFKVVTKLGLWGEAFLVLEDINTLMRVRRAPLKNSLRCLYFQNLALLFSKNGFWHYHAFAYFNYYNAYLTKPKITVQEKQQLSDRLLLSILAIPAVTLQSQQSKEIQEKVSAMMITSTKVPLRQQLVEIMVSRGVLENASGVVSQLWNFMFLQFGVNSLRRGLELVGKLSAEQQSFKELIEATLINKQLVSIAEVYQRIRIQSLERLIPLPLQKIKKMLILAHRQRIIDFTFDESQGIIVFEDHSQLVNPSEEFHSLFVEVAAAYEAGRSYDEKFIRGKAQEYLTHAENNIWSIRQYKIQEFKKKMKKPLMELRKQGMQREREERELREKEEAERRVRESEALRKGEELQKLLAMKKIIVADIVTIKEQRVVRIMDKKIEFLTDEEIDNLSLEVLQQHLENTRKKISNNKEQRLKKIFTNIDYVQRQRKEKLAVKTRGLILGQQAEKVRQQGYAATATRDYHEHSEQRARLHNLAKFYSKKIEQEVTKVYSQFDADLENYNNRVRENFKDKILAKAAALLDENKKKKELQLRQQEEQIQSTYIEGSNWSFKKKEVSAAPLFTRREEPSAPIKRSTNIFSNLEGVDKEDNSFRRPAQQEGKWGIGTKLTPAEQEKRDAANEAEKKKREEAYKENAAKQGKQEKPESKWSIGSKKVEQEKKPQVPVVANKNVWVPPPVAATQKKVWAATTIPEKKQVKKEEKKEQKKAGEPVKKGKAW